MVRPKPTATDTPEPSGPPEAAPGDPPPQPVAVKPLAKGDVHPDPTRYGDWERKGRCIDF